MIESQKISVVIPVLNEEESIETLEGELKTDLEKQSDSQIKNPEIKNVNSQKQEEGAR